MRGQPPRIEGEPNREPVNLQTALVMRRATWINRSPLEEPITREKFEAMKADLNALRIKHMGVAMELASTKRKLTNIVRESDLARKEYEKALKRLASATRTNNPSDVGTIKRCETLIELSQL